MKALALKFLISCMQLMPNSVEQSPHLINYTLTIMASQLYLHDYSIHLVLYIMVALARYPHDFKH